MPCIHDSILTNTLWKKIHFINLLMRKLRLRKWLKSHTGGWRQGRILSTSSFCIQNSGLKKGNITVWGVSNRERDGGMAANRWACCVPIGGQGPVIWPWLSPECPCLPWHLGLTLFSGGGELFPGRVAGLNSKHGQLPLPAVQSWPSLQGVS